MIVFLTSNICTLNVNAQTKNNTINYTVKKGDTYYLLGLRFNASIEEISSLNPKVNPYNLIIGSKIKLPVGSDIILHNIKKGIHLVRLPKNITAQLMLSLQKIIFQIRI